MTIDQALERGLLAKLKEAPLTETGQRLVRGHSPATGTQYAAVLYEATGAVEVTGPIPELVGPASGARTVPDDIVWGAAEE